MAIIPLKKKCFRHKLNINLSKTYKLQTVIFDKYHILMVVRSVAYLLNSPVSLSN